MMVARLTEGAFDEHMMRAGTWCVDTCQGVERRRAFCETEIPDAFYKSTSICIARGTWILIFCSNTDTAV